MFAKSVHCCSDCSKEMYFRQGSETHLFWTKAKHQASLIRIKDGDMASELFLFKQVAQNG